MLSALVPTGKRNSEVYSFVLNPWSQETGWRCLRSRTVQRCAKDQKGEPVHLGHWSGTITLRFHLEKTHNMALSASPATPGPVAWISPGPTSPVPVQHLSIAHNLCAIMVRPVRSSNGLLGRPASARAVDPLVETGSDIDKNFTNDCDWNRLGWFGMATRLRIRTVQGTSPTRPAILSRPPLAALGNLTTASLISLWCAAGYPALRAVIVEGPRSPIVLAQPWHLRPWHLRPTRFNRGYRCELPLLLRVTGTARSNLDLCLKRSPVAALWSSHAAIIAIMMIVGLLGATAASRPRMARNKSMHENVVIKLLIKLSFNQVRNDAVWSYHAK